MGRKRRKDLHLPSRFYERRGKYYFDSPVTKKWEPLGGDLALALAAYGRLIGPLWSGRTLADVFDRYQTQVTPLSGAESTRETEIRTLARFKLLFGTMQQDSLTARDLYLYIDKRIDERPLFAHLKKPAPAAAEHDVRFLADVLAKGIKWGAGTVNAAKAIQFDARPKNVRDVLEHEYQAVYALATERMQIAMDLASNIGQRRGDILKIRPRDDFTDKGILISQGKTKAAVLVKWSPGLRASVKRAQALKPDLPREFLLRTEEGTGYTRSGFGANWQRLMTKALKLGVISKRFKFHDLRAKAATEKAEQGTDKDAQELLGHKSVKTTGGYIRRRKPTVATPVR